MKNLNPEKQLNSLIIYKGSSIGDLLTISIIIPVYNASQFLTECLESVFNQGFGDVEIICVNDGSTDNSLEILAL